MNPAQHCSHDTHRSTANAALHILQHSLGLDQYGRGTFYRNHFVTGEGSVDHPVCMGLVKAGLMTLHLPIAIYPDMDVFSVTDAGKQYIVENSPTPPKLTRSQQRYGEWLKTKRERGK